MSKFCKLHEVELLAYCLMPNHVHMVAIPGAKDSLRLAIGMAHQHYTARINARQGWTGHLWQGRFSSYPMDNDHCLRAMSYVELNPVRAGLAERAEDYPWSSAKARHSNRADPLIGLDSMERLDLPLKERGEIYDPKLFRDHERSGQPLGNPEFIAGLEAGLSKKFGKKRPGRPPRLDSKNGGCPLFNPI